MELEEALTAAQKMLANEVRVVRVCAMATFPKGRLSKINLLCAGEARDGGGDGPQEAARDGARPGDAVGGGGESQTEDPTREVR